MARESFPFGSFRLRPGTSREVELPITRLVTGADVTLPVRVVHGKFDGPAMWLMAAVHGDEVVGVEVVRRVLANLNPKTLHGTLIAVPIVNVLGFMAADRYLPDRRDLNRCFPGSARGSLGSRMAHLLLSQIVAPCEVGIDLHTGASSRTNLPQIRADLQDERTRELAEAFGAPVMLHARLRDGSLRQAARERGCTVLLYEGGEAWRFDDWAIEAGVAGVRRVMVQLGMLENARFLGRGAADRVVRQRLGAGPAHRHRTPRHDAGRPGRGGRPARHPVGLLRPPQSPHPRRPLRHRHRPHHRPPGQPRRRAGAHRGPQRAAEPVGGTRHRARLGTSGSILPVLPSGYRRRRRSRSGRSTPFRRRPEPAGRR